MDSIKKIGGLKLQHELWLLVGIPALLMTFYAVIFSLERSSELQHAENIHHLTRTTGLLNIVHRLQFERGKAISYIAQRNNSGLQAWLESVKKSDSAITTLPKFIVEMQQQREDEALINTLRDIQNNIQLLVRVRLDLPNKESWQVKDVEINYGRSIDNIRLNINDLMRLISGGEIYQLIESMTAITELKEVSGLKRALGSAILKKGTASRAEINRLIEIELQHKIVSERFLKQTSVRFQERYYALGLDNKIENGFKGLLQLEADKGIEGDPQQWFSSMTQHIDKYRQLENSISDSLIQYAEDTRQRATSLLYLTIGVSLLILIILFKLAIYSTNKLSEGFVLLRGSAIQFIDTGKLSSVKIESNDELGELALTFNQLIEQLKSISKVVEAVAQGDFSQTVAEKSEDDRLSISLNHMVRTLSKSVDTLKQENWSKSGQSNLALQINADQRIASLTNNAISFLADYLNASVGAIYTVDSNEVSVLCA